MTTQNTPKELPAIGSWSIGNVGSAGEITLKWPNPSDSGIVKWRYRVRVLPDAGEPDNLAVVTASGQATLYWVNPNDQDVTRWQYRQKPESDTETGYSDWTNIPCSSPCAAKTQRHYTVTGLTDGTAYTFQVRAVKPNNAMEKPLAAVGRWSIGNIGSNGRVTLSWPTPSNSSFIDKYQYRKREGNSGWGAWTDIANSSASTTSYRAENLADGTKYAFEIRALSQNDAVVTTVGPWSFTAYTATNNRTALTWANPNNSPHREVPVPAEDGSGQLRQLDEHLRQRRNLPLPTTLTAPTGWSAWWKCAPSCIPPPTKSPQRPPTTPRRTS